MFGNNRQLEVARIFHYVDHCSWDVAKAFALRASEAEITEVINSHLNWRDAHVRTH